MPPFLVHIFTACGAACALLALLAAAKADFVTMFVWLAVALFIDGIDGTLARKFRVAEILPRWSGDALDLVIDFTTYVFVPAFALTTSGLLPGPVAIPLAIAIVVTSALYFADEQMKTADNYFRGFPALWNAVAFHLFVLKLPPWIAAIVVAVLVVMTFMPLRVLHPFRVLHLRVVNLLALAAWCALGVYALMRSLDPGPVVAWSLAAVGLYFLTIGLATADE
ncbi:CDP-alcohol phosphatidyltransferase family protein [Pseudorhodoplanes sp.]|uniref:CDP-alcohol phosphatidyltransferase family protein n=1 Tax=Pseudorhodoplanes sp. TaxID=1934341 RepID=UPI002CB66C4D|nr:CDP-alcohol phosphatidyltransferase family protein [Pseudorhodoplanes sp.]HWV52175.1 CDP-alcohol phosphatidyltransferase family protein [Pseudorhodoplanes sp.]